MRLGVAGVLLFGAATLGAQDNATGRIAGRVVSPAGNPIEGVDVSISGTGLTATTDADGMFRLLAIPPGRHYVRVRRIGYNAQLLVAEVRAGEAKQVEIALDRGAYELPELKVAATAAKPIEYGWTTRYDDFFRRQRVGLGAFLSRDDIDKRKPFRTPNLLVGFAGIRLRFYDLSPTGTAVEFSRCPNVGVWVDGYRQRYGVAGRASRDLGEYLNNLIPSQIEMMEVYRGPSEMPAEFIDDACAAIVIWTR